ncbi:MAG: hypothetical protein PHW60_15875 [Kiritimatiellae bacterium]|nr:hypothetical protein [Kiritimatiellia bacterium]
MRRTIMDAAYHRRRLRNLAEAGQAVCTCFREQAIHGYLAGQVTYNLGEYPAPFSIGPTQYDEHLLRQFAEHGVHLIQIHEEWCDSQRRLGADKLSSHDPEGLGRFVELAHSLGLKVILYASTGFFEATDPDFDPEWAHPKAHLVELFYDYAECSPAHPGWRAYVLPRLERVITEYGVDGLYNDMGYFPLHKLDLDPTVHISPAPETPECDAAAEDLLGLVMDLVHRHGGILKIHVDTQRSVVRNGLYDYLWVGEGVRDLDGLCRNTRGLKPYVVPCPDMSRAVIQDENDLYLYSVPYLQFPLRVDGRPCTGQRAAVNGMNYRRGEKCFWTRHMRMVWRNFQEHPDMPPMYGWWDSFPGRPEGRSRWLHHFDLYRPMVKNGSRAWLEIRDSSLFFSKIPDEVTVSLFVNDAMYLVLANYGKSPVDIVSRWQWRNRETGQTGDTLTLMPGTLRYYERADVDDGGAPSDQ